MSEFIIETKGLTKRYGEQYAVKDVDMHIRKNTIYGLLGRNGAGKTTGKAGINHLMTVVLAFVFGYSSIFTSGNKLLLNIYPLTAGLSIIGYRSHNPAVKGMLNPELSVVSLVLTAVSTLLIVSSTKQIKSTRKNKPKPKPKRGW